MSEFTHNKKYDHVSLESKEHIIFDIKLEAKDLFDFNIYQTYTSFNGWVSIILGVFMVVLGVMGIAGLTSLSTADQGYSFVYILVGIVILVYNPLTLWGRVKKTLKTNEVLANILSYDISTEKIAVSQGEASAELLWDQVYKMVGNKNRVLIYSNRVNAYVIPRTQLGDENYQRLKALADSKLPTYRNKMKAE